MARKIEPEAAARVSLQMEADRTGPKKRPSVVAYLAVMFAGAFLLLLISYLMELRDQAPQEAALPAMTIEEKQNLTEEIVLLNAENAEIRIQMKRLEERVVHLEKEVAELAAQQEKIETQDTAEESLP